MGKKNAELRIVLSDGQRHAAAATVILKKFDLYVINHIAPIAGKQSYHESGISHTDHEIISRRIRSEDRGVSLRRLEGFMYVTGWGAGRAPALSDYTLKSDTERRCTLLVSRPAHPWGVDVWAIQKSQEDLADKIRATPPWPRAEIAGSVMSAWTSPIILVTVWQGQDGSPYEVIGYSPSIPGQVPYVLVPEKWQGTWLETATNRRPRHPQVRALLEELKRQRGRA